MLPAMERINLDHARREFIAKVIQGEVCGEGRNEDPRAAMEEARANFSQLLREKERRDKGNLEGAIAAAKGGYQ